jgi:endogenous inhibitor of DNA gyrase (YacG/DUF329 family)
MGRPLGSKNKIDRGVYLNCSVCGNPFRVKESHVKLRSTCSRKCQTIKFNKYNGKWYKMISVDGKCKSLHRVLAEKELGHPLPPGAVVHHKNGNKNGGELIICKNQAEHVLIHAQERAFKVTGDYNKKLCPYCHTYDDKENMVSYPSSPERFVHRLCVKNAGKKRRESKLIGEIHDTSS